MLVLGTSPQDKGQQLEALTRTLLQHLGYRNCNANVMANGAEVDVRGELPLPGIGQVRSQRLICECKAHKSALDMTQWCKFLGKVYHQEICTQSEVAGCIIALSGINGYVQGNYDELCRHRSHINIVHGDSLLTLASAVLPFESLQDVSKRVRSMTSRTPSRFEVAYYDAALYWLVVFSGGEAAFFSGQGEVIEGDRASTLLEMVAAELDVNNFVNLREDAVAATRARQVCTYLIGSLIIHGGAAIPSELSDSDNGYSAGELEIAATTLREKGVLAADSGVEYVLNVIPTDHGKYLPIESYTTLFASSFSASVLASEFYQRHINDALLNEIARIQGNLDFDAAVKAEVLSVLRLSPLALARAIVPMEMIMVSRRQGPVHPVFDLFHRSYFRQQLLEALQRDFHDPRLSSYFHDVKGLRELETRTKLMLKSDSRVELDADFDDRIAIGQVAEAHGGGLVQVALLPDAPQPWDSKALSSRETKDDTEIA